MNTEYTVTEAANRLRRSVRTLQRWDRQGVLVPKRTITNRRVYSREQLDAFQGVVKPVEQRRTIAYCRVSSTAQKPDLKNQRSVVEDFCVAYGLSGTEFIEEIGGGLNFKRKKFLMLVSAIVSGEIGVLVLAHRDRLVRFGYDLLEFLCAQHGCKLLVINSEKLSPEQEMVQDLMTIIHCFSSRLYGLRNYRKSLKEALANPSP